MHHSEPRTNNFLNKNQPITSRARAMSGKRSPKERSVVRGEQAILKTLIYSDIFDFPLRKDELWRMLLTKRLVAYHTFEKALANVSDKKSVKRKRGELPCKVIGKDGYYCLEGREEVIDKRIRQLPHVRRKMRLAMHAASFLSYIPMVYFIGVSGGLAAENVSKADDVDLFIITKKHTLFLTRLFALGLLELMGIRRRRRDQFAEDKICLNLIIDEEVMRWSLAKQDLYTAHEMIRLKPLFERKKTYRKFLQNNSWVANFFVNATPNVIPRTWNRKYYTLQIISSILLLFQFERISRVVQRFFMHKHATTEVITNRFLAFHPNDYRSRSLNEFNSKIAKYRLLTNN